MPSFVEATVTSLVSERPGFQRVQVETTADRQIRPAYVLTDVIGPVAAGDKVVVNTTAVELGLGTGGSHVVHWNLSRTQWHHAGRGHVMKVRYTSVQLDTGVTEEADGYRAPDTLGGTPVVVCLLHSQLAAIAVALKYVRPTARITYVMTDQASLPMAMSDLVHDLRGAGLVDATVSAGQAFGGDHEAVNVASGLGVARALTDCSAIVVGPGPGVVGTGGGLAFGGLEAAAILHDVARYGGTPILALRWSDADKRARHRGLSHHSSTVLSRAPGSTRIAVPKPVEELEDATLVDTPDMGKLFAEHGLAVTTMGRRPDEDPGLFAFAGAAGVLAAGTLEPHG